MPARVMLVDDDRSLLNGLQRNLCFDYDLAVAESGPAALAQLDPASPFGVIVTDMRMPGMDGVAFIGEARAEAPDSTYIMLTGNQDLDTALQAVNEGHVFRFINKPCEVETIRSAIEAGLRQHELVSGEKELLNKTCAGAVSLLNEVLEANNPTVYARLTQLPETFDYLRQSVAVEPRWQFGLSSRLALVGFGCVDDATTDAFLKTPVGETAWTDALRRACEIGGRMVRRVPRLELIGDIIAACPSAEGAHCHQRPKSDLAIVQTASTLLRVAVTWNALTGQGLGAREACDEIRQLIPNLMDDYVTALQAITADDEQHVGKTVPLGGLQAGMVLHDDACDVNGSILLRKGSRLSEPLIEKLRGLGSRGGGLRPIVIVAQR